MYLNVKLPTPAQAYWNQRHILSKNRQYILTLSEVVSRPTDLSPFQWAQLMAFALEFVPDIILELGRGQGNSTCAFTQVAHWLKPHQCRVLSLCLSDYWEKYTLPKVHQIVPDTWFEPLQALQVDILTFDYKAALADCSKIFVFWDAHGYEIAECVLGEILPCLVNRPHVIVMHDLSDTRYISPSLEQYDNKGLWKGNSDGSVRVMLGHINSAVEQAVAIVDFTSRNHLPLHSADHDLYTEFNANQDRKNELQRCLGEALFSLNAHWFWFSMNQGSGSYTFPQYYPPSMEQSQSSKCPEQLSMKTRLKVALKILLNRYPVDKFL